MATIISESGTYTYTPSSKPDGDAVQFAVAGTVTSLKIWSAGADGESIDGGDGGAGGGYAEFADIQVTPGRTWGILIDTVDQVSVDSPDEEIVAYVSHAIGRDTPGAVVEAYTTPEPVASFSGGLGGSAEEGGDDGGAGAGGSAGASGDGGNGHDFSFDFETGGAGGLAGAGGGAAGGRGGYRAVLGEEDWEGGEAPEAGQFPGGGGGGGAPGNPAHFAGGAGAGGQVIIEFTADEPDPPQDSGWVANARMSLERLSTDRLSMGRLSYNRLGTTDAE